MPSGVFETRETLVQRATDEIALEIIKAGPFIEVELNGIEIGKVTKLSTILTEGGPAHGLRLPRHTILLTEKEAELLTEAFAEDARRRYEKKSIATREADEKRRKEEESDWHIARWMEEWEINDDFSYYCNAHPEFPLKHIDVRVALDIWGEMGSPRE